MKSDWINTKEDPPPNDYDFKCFIAFNDGHITLSDGGTIHDDKRIIAWMHIHDAVKYLPKYNFKAYKEIKC